MTAAPAPNAPLAPCPFCGSTDAYTEKDMGVTYVRCPKCVCFGPDCNTKAAAIAAWNTRPAAATVDAELVAVLKHVAYHLREGVGGLPEEIIGNSGERDDFNVTLYSTGIELIELGKQAARALAHYAPTQPAAPGAQAEPGLEQAGQGGARGASGSSTHST